MHWCLTHWGECVGAWWVDRNVLVLDGLIGMCWCLTRWGEYVQSRGKGSTSWLAGCKELQITSCRQISYQKVIKLSKFFNNILYISRPSDYEDNSEKVDKNTDEEAEERLKLLFFPIFWPQLPIRVGQLFRMQNYSCCSCLMSKRT